MPRLRRRPIWKVSSEDDSWKIPECVPNTSGWPANGKLRSVGGLARSTTCLRVMRSELPRTGACGFESTGRGQYGRVTRDSPPLPCGRNAIDSWLQGAATIRTYSSCRSVWLWRQLPDRSALNRTGVDNGCCHRTPTTPHTKLSRIGVTEPFQAARSSSPLFNTPPRRNHRKHCNHRHHHANTLQFAC